MFTKQHYIEVARILRETGMNPETRDELIQKFSYMFKRDNSRFDSSRFVDAATGVTAPKARRGSIFD